MVVLERAGEFYRVKTAGIVYLPPAADASKDEILTRQKAAIQSLKDSCQIKDKSQVVVSLPSNSIFVRYLDILKSQKKKENDFVKFEAKQQIPFPLEEVAWDYFFVKSKAGGNRQAVLMAIKNDLMEESIQLIESAKLKAKTVNLGLVNLLNISFLNISFKRNEMGILVDIGSEATGVIINNKGELWLRSFSLGSGAMTRDIAEALNVGLEEAEKIKRMGPEALEKSDSERAQTVRDVIISNLVKLSGEIERSIEFFNSEQEKKGADTSDKGEPKVILTGGICSMEGVESFFSDRLGIPTSTLNIERKIEIPSEGDGSVKVVGGEEASVQGRSFPYHFGIAVGAAIALSGKEEFKINLLKHKAALPGAKKSKPLAGFLGTVFLLSAAAVFLVFLFLGNQVNRSRLEAVEKVLAKFESFRTQVIQIEENQKTLKDEAAFYINFSSKRYLWLNAMNELTQIIPLNIWIEEWHSTADLTGGDQDSLQIRGFMLSYDDFNEFIGNVKSLSFVRDVKPQSIETEEGQFRFTLDISVTQDLPILGGAS